MARNYSGHIIIDIYFDKTYVEKKKTRYFGGYCLGVFNQTIKFICDY
ncbi:hypothetical protein HMPREF1563_2367 [Providencia alcalifaciens 205/92]|uniref:Transposase n=1 Tax=Providencia alcalifaciens 205/92 TaxID=1256988 RepID=A0AAV3MB74_9GAMM|nr:hypothetical protein HMPREF1563_2367 [Providencia alcalifaciens 205/92]